jgi:hypothetical protein
MKKNEIGCRPSDLLRDYLSKTSPEKIAEIIADIDKFEINGPTFDEYMEILQSELDAFYSNVYLEEVYPVELKSIFTFQFDLTDTHYSSPPDHSGFKEHEKDSANYAESFFFL